MPFDLDATKRALRALKRNLHISQQRIGDRPMMVDVRIPIHAKWGETNQQGETKVHVIREIEAVDHRPPPSTQSHEYLEWQRMVEAHNEVCAMCARKRIHLDREARTRWIAGRAGVPYNTAKHFLR